MRNRLLIVALLAVLAGCKSKQAVPIGILPPKKMQAVLWDMMRADQFLADYVLNRDTSKNNKTETLKLYQQVFAIHQIDKAIFQQSFSYYQSHPDLLKVIMDSISTPPKEMMAVTPLSDTPQLATVPVADTLQNKADTLHKNADTLKKIVDTLHKNTGKPITRDTLLKKRIKKRPVH